MKAAGHAWFGDVTYFACDLHQVQAPPSALSAVDVVLHLAWPGLPNYKSLFHFETNLPADYRFLKWLIERGVRRVVVAGTCLEYGMRSGCLTPDLPSNPTNPYALAKDTLRKFLQSLQQQRDFELRWARLFYMYGEGQHPNSLLSQLDRAIDNGDAVFNMSKGEQLRDYLPISEMAALLVTLAEGQFGSGIFNCCSGVPISVRSLVEQHIKRRNALIALNLGHYPYIDYEPMAFWGSRDQSVFGVSANGSSIMPP
jgi:nucleoside-diphosphate-sugar epimerase